MTGTGDGGVSNLGDLAIKLASDPAFHAKMKDNPSAALAEVASTEPLKSDVWIYRIVVGSLGVTVLTSVVGFIVLAFDGKAASEGMVALGSAAVGAIAGLLAPSPGSGK